MNKKIKWGIIGPGRIAQQFAHDMPFATKGELLAVASRDMTRSEAFAKAYNIPMAYGSYDEMLANPEIDAVYIAVPHAFHYEVALQVMDAGKAVLCEKPLTITTEKCDAMCIVAQEKGLYLMEGMWTYFLPPVLKAKAWLAEGRIGGLHHLQCDFGWVQPKNDKDRWYNPDLAGGALFDMGCYNLAMADFFIDKELQSFSMIGRKASTGVDEVVNLMLDYGDCDAMLQTSFVCNFPNACRLIGEKGYIEITDFWSSKKCTLHLNDGTTEIFEDKRHIFGFNYEIDAVSQDILDGKLQSEVVPHTYSQKIMRLMEAVLSEM